MYFFHLELAVKDPRKSQLEVFAASYGRKIVLEPEVDYLHPYEFEINSKTFTKVDLEYEDWMVSTSSLIHPLPLEETPLIYVSEKKQIPIMIEELEKEDIIGVDLENHSYHSFQGYLCLMQVYLRI